MGVFFHKRAIVKYDVILRYKSKSEKGKREWIYSYTSDVSYNDDAVIQEIQKIHKAPSKATITILLTDIKILNTSKTTFTYDENRQGVLE